MVKASVISDDLLEGMTPEELAFLQRQLEAMTGETPSVPWEDPSDGVLTQLLEAAEAGDAQQISQLTEQARPHINTPGPDGDTALHIASLFGHEAAALALLEAGADAGAVNEEDGSTVLHDAAAAGLLGIVQRIIQSAPQSVNHADNDGDTPLHNAARGNHKSVVEMLLQAGADKHAKNEEGNTPAQEADDPEVIAILQ